MKSSLFLFALCCTFVLSAQSTTTDFIQEHLGQANLLHVNTGFLLTDTVEHLVAFAHTGEGTGSLLVGTANKGGWDFTGLQPDIRIGSAFGVSYVALNPNAWKAINVNISASNGYVMRRGRWFHVLPGHHALLEHHGLHNEANVKLDSKLGVVADVLQYNSSATEYVVHQVRFINIYNSYFSLHLVSTDSAGISTKLTAPHLRYNAVASSIESHATTIDSLDRAFPYDERLYFFSGDNLSAIHLGFYGCSGGTKYFIMGDEKGVISIEVTDEIWCGEEATDPSNENLISSTWRAFVSDNKIVSLDALNPGQNGLTNAYQTTDFEWLIDEWHAVIQVMNSLE